MTDTTKELQDSTAAQREALDAYNALGFVGLPKDAPEGSAPALAWQRVLEAQERGRKALHAHFTFGKAR